MLLLLSDRDKGKTSQDLLLELYGKVHKAVEVCSTTEGLRKITIMIDDVSLMEIDADGSSNLILNFVHYCYGLTTQFVSQSTLWPISSSMVFITLCV